LLVNGVRGAAAEGSVIAAGAGVTDGANNQKTS
jgi:hypothetical protein